MNFRSFWEDDNLFWGAIVLSLLLHALLFYAGQWSVHFQQKHTVEIDITNMGHLGMSAAPRLTPAPAPARPAPKPAAPLKEWTRPAANQKVEPAPIPTRPVAVSSPEETPPPVSPSAAIGTGEYGIGTGDTTATVLSRIPQLLNLSDLRAIMQRFYPEEARSQGREATVVLDIHIDTTGQVTSVDVVRPGGADFDEAAKKATRLLRFTPAFLGSQRVNVKMRQAIQFKLEQ